MALPTRDSDLAFDFALYLGAAACVFGVLAVVGGLVLLARHYFKNGRLWQWRKL